MKISYHWLKEYIQTDLSPEEMGKILTQTGLEVEGITKVEKIPGGLNGLVVGEVLSKTKHPNADRLNVTSVDIGNGEPLQIVCGAPNVDQGQKVVVATVGTTLHPLEGEPFKIKKGKIRGEASIGMICAEDEIGVGKSHDGIIILDPDTPVGKEVKEVYDLGDDFCIEIGLTPNRTDGMSHLGVARDLKAALKNMEGIDSDLSAEVEWPDLSNFSIDNHDLKIEVAVENETACPRYCGLTLSDVKVESSPSWLKDRLIAIGLKPINNVVDITNFVLHEYGQPLHAFDAEKIEGNKVVVKNLASETSFTTLDEVERKLDEADLIICNGNPNDSDSGMCIAGVFGGIDSGVTEKTQNVFLESAYFQPVSVRKTAKRHGLNTDASFRFERGVDPNITVDALKRAALLIREICGAKISSEITDLYKNPIENCEVTLQWKNIKRWIGMDISKEKSKSIFADLDILIKSENDESVILEIPAYRADVTREADVIEEILRIYGYNNIEAPNKMTSSLSYRPQPDEEKIQHLVSDYLSSLGFFEMMSNSLTKDSYHEKYQGQEVASANNIAMLNPLSRDLNVLRQSLLFGGLEAIVKNQNFKNDNLALYEFGKEYRKSEESYKESKKLVLFLTGNKTTESWNSKEEAYDFFDLKGLVENVCKRLGLYGSPKFEDFSTDIIEDGLILKLQNKAIATLGKVHHVLTKDFDIKKEVFYADIHWDTLMGMMNKVRVKFKPIAKFPSTRRDLSLLIDKTVNFDQIHSIAAKTDRKILKEIDLFDVYEGENMEEGKKSYAVSFIFQDENKTLTDKEVDKVMSKIQQNLEREVGARLR